MDNPYYLLMYCTSLCFLSEFLSIIVKPIISLLTHYRRTDCVDLRSQIVATTSEMDRLSITDDFAKYIRLQRKLKVLQHKLKCDISEQLKYSLKIRYGTTYMLYGIINIFYFFICWSNWGSTVLTLPEHWLFPFSKFLAWPTSVSGGISVPNWLLISNVTAKLISKYIKSS